MWKLLSGAMLLVLLCGTQRGDAGEPAAGTTILFPRDGAEMVYVPAGDFIMGIDAADAEILGKDLGQKQAADLWAWDNYPRHKVHVEGYFIDKYEVSVARWKKFVLATGFKETHPETSRHFDKPDEQLLPAAEMKWKHAKQYGAWAGKLLPSEAQWEKAARGTDGRLYPWGNAAPTMDRGHFSEKPVLGKGGKMPPLYTRIGRFPKGNSPYGCYDMLGNQYEWTSDMNSPYPNNPEAEKMKDYGGKMPVLRGGSWYHGWVGYYAAKRFGFEVDETYYHVGFRTIWTPPAGYFASPAFQKDLAAAQQHPEVPGQ